MTNRAPTDIHQAIRNYEASVEQLQRVSHYVDHDFMGRLPTATEMEEFTGRRKEMENALRKVCSWPATDWLVVRRKMRFLDAYLKENSLGRGDCRAVVSSILAMRNHGD